MINKLDFQSIVNKYYLGENESVKWVTKDNHLTIDFMSPNQEVIGKVQCLDFPLQDSELAIFDTKKLTSLINITSGKLLLELEQQKAIFTKLKIEQDSHKFADFSKDIVEPKRTQFLTLILSKYGSFRL